MAHMHYKGTGKVHSFRGLLADGAQRKVRIQGSVGAIAWRITKFEVMPYQPAEQNQESTLKIYREEQTSVDAVVDFEDDELVGAAWISNSTTGIYYPIDAAIIFDNALFVRNIWITHSETLATEKANYYIELEEVKVSKAGMAQLAVAAARRTID